MAEKDKYWDCLDHAVEAAHLGRTEDALSWYDQALKANPGGAEAHNGRGEILWEDGRVEEALYEVELATQADPKFVTAHLNRAELLIEELGEPEQAIQYCDFLLSGGDPLPRLDRGTEAEVHYLKSKGFFYLDDLEGALFLARRAIKTAGDVPVYRAFEGQLCFELGRFEEARRQLEHAVAIDPESAHALYHLGLALERLGEDPSAAFHQANALQGDQYPLPVEVDDKTFHAIVAEALADLQKSFREILEPLPVLVEDYPDRELLSERDISPQILGLYEGVPLTEAALTEQPQGMNRVLIFKKNLEKVCRTHAELVEQIQITVRHEIGHHLGLDEDDLERLGLA